MEFDPVYVANQIRLARKLHRLKQSTLAELAGLDVRTIQYLESGRRAVNVDTLRQVAKGLKIEITYFVKPTPHEELRQKQELENTLRKTILVPTRPVRTIAEFIHEVDQWQACRFDKTSVVEDEAVKLAGELNDWIEDVILLGWHELKAADQFAMAQEFLNQANQLEKFGYICHLGHNRQMRPDWNMTLTAGLVAIKPKKKFGEQGFAFVQLEGLWETVEADRPVPDKLVDIDKLQKSGFSDHLYSDKRRH